MLLIPAIDLKDGHCVRLKQGDMDQSTTFGEDPAAMARKWVDAGARRLHLVDLNGAFAGKPKNYAAIKAILKDVGSEIPVQLGGGQTGDDTELLAVAARVQPVRGHAGGDEALVEGAHDRLVGAIHQKQFDVSFGSTLGAEYKRGLALGILRLLNFLD